jgi:type VII secretion integral membrane protein EccD
MTRPDAGLARADAGAEGTRFCRVTVLAPTTRMDLALPTDLTVAELVPMLRELAEHAGGRAVRQPLDGDRDGVPAAWCLAAAAGAELPAEATLAELGVLDGDLLRLRRRSEAPPPPVFDDPVVAVAEAVAGPAADPGGWPDEPPADADGSAEPLSVRPWNGRCRRAAAMGSAVAAALAASVLLAAARGFGEPAHPVAAAIGGLAASAALAGAVRVLPRDGVASVTLATSAVPLSSAAGFAALPGVPGAGHLLLAASLASATSAAGLALLSTAAPVLVAGAVATAIAALAALPGLFGFASASGLAAGAAVAALGLLPLLPRAGIRLAGLPPPVIPTTPEEMITADARWELTSAEEIRYQSRLAHTYLAGLVLGVVAVASVGAVVAASGGRWGQLFAAVVAAVLLLRSRGYVTAAASAAPLVGGLLTGLALVTGLARTAPELVKLVAVPPLLAAAAVAVSLVWTGPRREPSPVLRRAVDVVEAVLVVAAFPLALAVLGLYQLVRGL